MRTSYIFTPHHLSVEDIIYGGETDTAEIPVAIIVSKEGVETVRASRPSIYTSIPHTPSSLRPPPPPHPSSPFVTVPVTLSFIYVPPYGIITVVPICFSLTMITFELIMICLFSWGLFFSFASISPSVFPSCYDHILSLYFLLLILVVMFILTLYSPRWLFVVTAFPVSIFHVYFLLKKMKII